MSHPPLGDKKRVVKQVHSGELPSPRDSVQPAATSLKLEEMFLDDDSLKTYQTFLREKVDYSTLTGLWNAKTNKIALGAPSTHETLALEKRLLLDGKTLQENWHGFIVTLAESKIFLISGSDMFGMLPLPHRPKFEETMRTLSPDYSDRLVFTQLEPEL
jgi:hypothetical protein